MYDFESTIQDDDILQAQYERESAEARRDTERGICNHSWRQGVPTPGFGFEPLTLEYISKERERGAFPDRPTERVPVKGEAVCLDCGKIMKDEF